MQVISFSNGPSDDMAIEMIVKKAKEKYVKEPEYFTDTDDNDFEYSTLPDIINTIETFPRKRLVIPELEEFFSMGDRITFSIKPDNYGQSFENCKFYDAIQSLIIDYGYEIKDYLSGICTKEGRDFKIGKVLKKINADEFYINGFANSPYRSTTKKKYVVTLSKNIYDIMTMSAFRGWTSCMNILGGGCKSYVEQDVKHGTLILYIHEENDTEIDRPSARILIKPYRNSEFYFYVPEITTYGSTNVDMYSIASKICSTINGLLPKPSGDIVTYNFNDSLYNDGLNDIITINRNGWDFNKESDIFMFSKHCHFDGDLKETLKDNKNKELLILNRYFDSIVTYEFTQEFLSILVDNEVSLDGIFDRFYTKLSQDEIIQFVRHGINPDDKFYHLLENDKISNYNNMSEVLSKEMIHIMNMNKSTTKYEILTEEELRIIDNNKNRFYLINPKSTLMKSIIYNSIYSENSMLLIIASHIFNMRDVIEEEFTKEEITSLFINLFTKRDGHYVGYYVGEVSYKFISKYVDNEELRSLVKDNRSFMRQHEYHDFFSF